jgi:hypothetical protein
MNFLKIIPKKIYYKILDPALRKFKCDILDEVRSRDADILDEVRSRDADILDEVNKVRDINVELQSKLSQQIADEVVRLNKVIESLRIENNEPKLSALIVNELIKIHQSLERLSKS